jgi:hypothetical protein
MLVVFTPNNMILYVAVIIKHMAIAVKLHAPDLISSIRESVNYID